jgi:hypothetical protein
MSWGTLSSRTTTIPGTLLVGHKEELSFLDVGTLLEVHLLEARAYPDADGYLLEGTSRTDGLGHDRDRHPAGLDDRDHPGRRDTLRLDPR